ncbi:MAG: hypothetical protein GTO02_21900 [Candidatus Dadabacteria bacterium]|nr:hypothetical protein [Candidatus Dadabacteria bacterium]NIQ16939.1 hypothetical protein [Candidatus Dadabacteria bacterium]
MDPIKIFENYSSDFELTIVDDNWSRLEKYFAKDATYLNVGFPESISKGPVAIIEFLKIDVSKYDRKFDSRTLTGLTPPKVENNRLSRTWRCTYKLAGTKDLVLEGESRYLFADNLIKEYEGELTSDSFKKLEEWMKEFGEKIK